MGGGGVGVGGRTVGAASRLKPEEAPSPDTTRAKGSRRRLHGQLGVLENVAQMLCEMTAAAESKTEFAANEVVAEMVCVSTARSPFCCAYSRRDGFSIFLHLWLTGCTCSGTGVCVCACACACACALRSFACACACACVPILFIFLASQVATLRTSEPKLLEMITTADEKTIQTLLEVNDLLQGALSEYEHVIKHGPRRTAPAPVPAPRSAAVAGGATPVPAGVVAPPKPSCMHVRIVYVV